MPKENDDKNQGKRLVVCPECDTQCDVNEDDECPKCKLNVARVYEQFRYKRALRKLEDAIEDDKKKKKKDTGWNPFAGTE